MEIKILHIIFNIYQNNINSAGRAFDTIWMDKCKPWNALNF